MKLTATQKKYLKAMPDWSARYEILQRLGRPLNFQSDGILLKALRKLEREGLVEYGRANDTYRSLWHPALPPKITGGE